ncbi:WD repeat-containing protein 26 homolog [Salvia hispanica]|uniref:WD repeat-containing protein 26 homolog n=1 Tax=Salvia hispanica TaxID=49212 RepID=UPI0020090EEE|nr:WD repeat-containing protein 26 homolog [Salvia hispanica]XP_047950522.1 WD repeat-containing protein 26 homolog [Salvia hispanica]
MGGVEDDEPPSKRVKVTSIDSGGISNSLYLRQRACTHTLSDSMARLLATEGDDEVVGSKGIIKKVELVRVIAEALYSLGYSKSGACLEEESGIPFHAPEIDFFMHHILEGQWDESVAVLHKFGVTDETIVKLASLAIFEQKFSELLDDGKVMDALETLRTEITPLCVNYKRVRELSSLVLSPSQNLLDGTSSKGSKLESRKILLDKLRKLLPPKVIVPEKRLVQLVEQALVLQKDACKFHNSSVGKMSLLADHQCGRDHIPTQTLQVLQEHEDEILVLQFSHNGKYLASSSGDHLVIIWEVLDAGQVLLKHRLYGHQKSVSCISWSPDDKQLLTCGGELVRRWDVTLGECLYIYEKSGLGLVSCAWAPDGKSVFSGVTDKSIIMWDLEGKELECWRRQRTLRNADLGITSNTKELITVCKETVVLLFGWESKSERFIEEDQIITSFSLSEDGKFLLLSLWNEELHLWNIDGSPRLVSKYKGHKRSRFVLQSCFGGLDHAFISSGSEDSQVYIWHRLSGELILTLAGHTGAVNCVSWNPANPHMLASASDDRTIRIWGLNQVNVNNNGRHSNGVHHCNGGS